MKLLMIVIVGLLLSACDPPTRNAHVDQCKRAELFEACMKLLPAGPQSTQYNDWDDVVSACNRQAYQNSLRVAEQIPLACRAD